MSTKTFGRRREEESDELEEGPDEEDVTIQDVGYLGSGTAAFQGGKQIAKLENDDYDQFYEAINTWMKQHNFFPSVWYVSDHGNVSIDSGFIEYCKTHPVV